MCNMLQGSPGNCKQPHKVHASRLCVIIKSLQQRHFSPKSRMEL